MKYDINKTLYEKDNRIILPETKIGGEFRVVVLDKTGVHIEEDTGWFSNLITDAGLVNMGNASHWSGNFNVGTSNVAPSFTDTSLYGWLDEIYGSTVDTGGAGGSGTPPSAPNYEYYNVRKGRFLAGLGPTTLREVGLNSHLSGDNISMSVRALITPEVSVGAENVVDVYYKLTRWQDMSDVTGTIDIGGTDYDYILRRAYMTECCGQYTGINTFGIMALRTASQVSATADTEISASVESGPDYGGTTNPTNDLGGKISSASGTRDDYIEWYITRAVGNIRSIKLREADHGTANQRGYQLRLGRSSDDAMLVKTDTQRLRLNFRTTWARI